MPRLLMILCLVAMSACNGDSQNPAAPAPAPLPNYTGVWTGTYTVTSCTQNGGIAAADACSLFTTGSNLPFQLNLIQQGSQITQGTFTLGTIAFTAAPATLTASGAVTVSGSMSADGITIVTTWNLNAPIAGTMSMVWTASGVTGQVNIANNVGAVVKTGSVRAPVAAPTSVPDLLRQLRQ